MGNDNVGKAVGPGVEYLSTEHHGIKFRKKKNGTSGNVPLFIGNVNVGTRDSPESSGNPVRRNIPKIKFRTLGKTSADNGNVIEVKQNVRSQHDNTAE